MNRRMSRAENSVKESMANTLLTDWMASDDKGHRFKFRRTKATYGDSRAMEGK